MSHYSLLCFIFINSLTIFTVFTFRSFSAVRTVTVSPRLLHTALPPGNWLPTLRVRIRPRYSCLCGISVSVHLNRRHKYLFIPDNAIGVQLSTLLQAHDTSQNTTLLLLQTGCVVLPKSQFLVICFAQSDWTSLSTWHTNMKLNIYSGIRFAERFFLTL